MPCLYMSCCSGWNAVTPVLVLLFTVVRDGRRQSTQLFSGQVSLWIDMTCDQNQTSNSLSVYRLMNMSTHREARIRHKTVTINFIASCQFLCCRSQTFSYQQLQQLIFQVFLQYCNQTFQIQQHISHPVCVAGAFHVYHLCFFGNHCIRSTPSTASKKLFSTFLHFHHSLGQPLLVRCHGCSQPARRQDSKILRRHVKTAAIMIHLKNNAWLHRNLRISCEKRHQSMYIQARATASSTNLKVYQLHSWAWHHSKKRNMETTISLSAFHIASFHSAPPASTHRRRPHCALNPVAFVAAGHRGASRCDSAGILRRGALEGQSILTSLLSEHENHWLSDIFDCDNDGDGLRTCSKKITNRHGAPIPVSSLDTNCLLYKSFQTRLRQVPDATGQSLKIRDSWNSNSNEIVAFYTLNPQEADFFVALVWPSRLTHRTWSAWRLRQIDGVPFTWKNNSWWDRWTYAGESGNVWSIW